MKTITFLLLSFSLCTFASELKLTSYNLGLAHTFVPHAKERLPFISEALKNHDADILCLQEAWTKSDRKKLKSKIEDNFKDDLITKIKNFRDGRRPTCKVKELFGEGKFVSCMQNQCKDLDGDDFTDCILSKCAQPLADLKNSNRQCATALMAQVGKNTIIGMLTILNPIVRAGLFAYKGSDGLMLFSKYPITSSELVDFSQISTLNRRRALKANIDINGKNLTVFCTHLSADLSRTVPYTGKFETWAEENNAQITQLMNEAEKSTSATVVMGDMNCGYSSNNVDGELEANCQELKRHNFINALQSTTPECTFCKSNLLNESETKSVAIDHVLIKGASLISTSIDFKERIFLESGEQTNLSDHYGVSVEVSID